jgi:murein DD-endopeptidase MepM/ murein hydrolase activator NlpD
MDGTVALPTGYSEETQYVVFHASEGTKIVASGDGTISSVTPNANYGYEVQIDHGNGYFSYYFNESEPIVSEGDKVIRGTTLFIIESDEQKLVYQIAFNNQYIDPMSVIEIKG